MVSNQVLNLHGKSELAAISLSTPPLRLKGSVDLGRSDFSQVGQPAVCSDGLFQAAQGPCRCTLDFRRGFGGKWAELLRKLDSFSFVAFFKFRAFFDKCCPADLAEDLTLASVSSSSKTFSVGQSQFFFDVLGIGCLLVEGWLDSVLLEYFFWLPFVSSQLKREFWLRRISTSGGKRLFFTSWTLPDRAQIWYESSSIIWPSLVKISSNSAKANTFYFGASDIRTPVRHLNTPLYSWSYR